MNSGVQSTQAVPGCSQVATPSKPSMERPISFHRKPPGPVEVGAPPLCPVAKRPGDQQLAGPCNLMVHGEAMVNPWPPWDPWLMNG